MSTTEIARRYARAMFVLAKQKGVHAQALVELRAIGEILEREPTIREYFANPLIPPDQKLQVVKAALTGKGLLEETLNLMTLLAERGRLSHVLGIVDAFQERIDEENGVTRGVVRAAKPLTPDAMKELETNISGTLKKKIVLSFKEDSRLLGGVVAQVGGWTFDDSIETHLRKMNEELNRSAR